MDKKILTRITLIAAAGAAVSMPLVAQMLRATDTGRGPAAPAVTPVAQARPATAPAAPATAPTTAPATAQVMPAAPVARPVAVVPPVPVAPPVLITAAVGPTSHPAVAPPAPPTAPTTSPAVASAAPATAPLSPPPPVAPAETAPAAAASAAPPTRPAARPADGASSPVVRDVAGNAIDPDRVVISVGDDKLTAADVDAFISDLPPGQQSAVRGAGRRGLADYLVNTELLAREARARRLDQDPRVRMQVRLAEDQALARAMSNDVKENVDDAAVRKFFDEHRRQLEIVHARHILVRTPGSKVPPRAGQKELTEEQAMARATEIYNRVKAGADFADVARRESDDAGTAREGGDLGRVSHGRTDAEPFEKAAFSLKEGEVSPPVRSAFGWHVVQVLERFDSPEKLAEQIRGVIAPQQTQDLLDALEKSHRAVVDDTFFGPPAPAEPR